MQFTIGRKDHGWRTKSVVTYFSAFAGIGGFDIGIKNVWRNAKCVGYSEVDKHAIKIYEKHYPGIINFGDISRIRPEEIPKIDIFAGGFPCQDISIAGKRAGLQGKRSGLFFEIIRIIHKSKPSIVFLENVEGLLSSNGGWDFAKILTELDGEGYDIEWFILNAKDWGVPQQRKRVFIIGHLRGMPQRQIFPIRKSNKDIIKSGGEHRNRMVSNAIDSNYYKGADGKRQMICINSQPRCGDPKKGGTGLLISSENCFSLNHVPHMICDSGISHKKEIRNDTIPPLRANTGAGSNNVLNFFGKLRRLTPLECERLQGFPDRWTEGIADSNRYKCLGNAVAVPVIEEICWRLKRVMETSEDLSKCP